MQVPQQQHQPQCPQMQHRRLVNPKKDELDSPSTVGRFLGTEIDTHAMIFRVPKDRIRAIVKAAVRTQVDSAAQQLTLRQLASFIGKVQATSAAVPFARFKCRHLLHAKNAAFKRSPRWSLKVTLPREALIELQ